MSRKNNYIYFLPTCVSGPEMGVESCEWVVRALVTEACVFPEARSQKIKKPRLLSDEAIPVADAGLLAVPSHWKNTRNLLETDR